MIQTRKETIGIDTWLFWVTAPWTRHSTFKGIIKKKRMNVLIGNRLNDWLTVDNDRNKDKTNKQNGSDSE